MNEIPPVERRKSVAGEVRDKDITSNEKQKQEMAVSRDPKRAWQCLCQDQK
jgi:hypothetical protein